MHSDNEDLLGKALRDELSASERRRWEQLLQQDPSLQDAFAEEVELERALSLLPDVPISSNFTSLAVQAAMRDTRRKPAKQVWKWPLWRLVSGGALVVAACVYGLRIHSAKQAEMAINVRSFSEVASVIASSQTSPAEVFQNFDAIQRLSLPADNELDMELLVALQK